MRNRNHLSVGKAIVVFFFIVLALSVIFPMIWMVISSLKKDIEFYDSPWRLPAVPQWNNYVRAFKYGVGKYFFNSLYITACTVILTVCVSAMAAYILSRYQFKGKELVVILALGGMAISPEVNLVALYKIMRNLHLYNSRLGLILLYTAFRISFTTMLIRSYMIGLPQEVEEAAYIDGCTAIKVFSRVILPMSRPILASGALLTAMESWNEYMFAVTFIESDTLKTIPIGLVSLESTLRTNQPVLISALVITSGIMIAAFLVFQRQFIEGLTNGGVKG